MGKKFLSLVLSLVMVIGMVAAGGTGFIDAFYSLTVKASASKITEYKTGDTVEFGWYPQSKVTDEELISALNNLAGDNASWTSYDYYSGTGGKNGKYDGEMTASDYMRYTDIVYGTDKYRGVIFDNYRPYFTGYEKSGSTYQDVNGYEEGNVYWFKYEPVQWRVLDPETGLVMADSILDSQAYNNYILKDGTDVYDSKAYWGDAEETYYANNYEKSSIREWLNDDFYNTAFSSAQQGDIKSTELDNSAWSEEDSGYGCESTNDKIFLLSWSEVTNSSYGFSESEEESDTRCAYGTDYAKSQGLYDGVNWSLRTAGSLTYRISSVYDGGAIKYATEVSRTDSGIRPALRYDTTSEITQCEVTETGSGSGSGTADNIAEYGWYPQSQVTDEELIEKLNSSVDSDDFVSFGYYCGTGSVGTEAASDYMLYADTVVSGEKYRGVIINEKRPLYSYNKTGSYVFTQRNFTLGQVYWFKYEPIQWIILDEDTGLVISKNALDASPFNNASSNADESGYNTDYDDSSLRSFVSGEFIENAFGNDLSKIITPSGDSVFIPSEDIILNTQYGLSVDSETVTQAAYAGITDYDLACGMLGVELNDTTYAPYWLDSAYNKSFEWSVFATSSLQKTNVYQTLGVRLCTYLDLEKTSENCCSHYFEKQVIDPTCDKDGYTLNTCVLCGYEYESDIVPARHTPGEPVIENEIPATETEGKKYDEVVYCSVCKTELSRETVTSPFISASVDKAQIIRAERVTWTVKTTSEVEWLELYGTYTTSSGDEKILSTFFKASRYLDSDGEITVSDSNGIRTWSITMPLSYTTNDEKVDVLWTVKYKIKYASEWEDSDSYSNVLIGKNADTFRENPSPEYDKYTLVSVTAPESAKAGEKIEFKIVVTDDITKVRIGYTDANGKARTATYQSTSSSVTGIEDNGDGTVTWTVSYKVPAVSGSTAFSVQSRGPAWGEAKTSAINVG